MSDKKLKKCEYCGNTIPKTQNRSWEQNRKKKNCCKECSYKSQDNKQTVKCECCGKEIKRSKSHIRGRVYFSRECRIISNTIEKQCEYCGKIIRKPKCEANYGGFYCGRKCAGMAIRKNEGQNQGRRSPEDLEWKKEILKRGNYKCAMCGSNRRLEAHHIKRIEEYPELRHELSNGICLCHDCHYYKIHKGAPNFKHGRYSRKKK